MLYYGFSQGGIAGQDKWVGKNHDKNAPYLLRLLNPELTQLQQEHKRKNRYTWKVIISVRLRLERESITKVKEVTTKLELLHKRSAVFFETRLLCRNQRHGWVPPHESHVGPIPCLFVFCITVTCRRH
jgi:hypothetical protein